MSSKSVATTLDKKKSIQKKTTSRNIKKIGDWTITGPSNKEEYLLSMAAMVEEWGLGDEQIHLNCNSAFALEALSKSKEERKKILAEIDKGYSLLKKIHQFDIGFLNNRNLKMFNDDLYIKISDPSDFPNAVLESLKNK